MLNILSMDTKKGGAISNPFTIKQTKLNKGRGRKFLPLPLFLFYILHQPVIYQPFIKLLLFLVVYFIRIICAVLFICLHQMIKFFLIHI